jgi:hypothetical protein
LVSGSHHWLEVFSFFYAVPAVQSLERDPSLAILATILAHERTDTATRTRTAET